MSAQTLSENQHRTTIYRLLSACFYQPEVSFIEEDLFGQLATAFKGAGTDLADMAEKLDSSFRQAGLDKLLSDYSRLFLGPFEILAKPYGSVYLDGERVVMGDSTMAAVACYREAAFEVAEDFREMPDHIAVQLEFLYLLCFNQNEALASADQAAQQRWLEIEQIFLANHLGRWVGDFCQRIREHAETEHYRLLAELTETFILQQKG
jgi:TorA maturation chaperone TorD